MLRFLIDECVTPDAALYAKSAGCDAYHVNWLHLNGYPDRALLPIILGEDFIFVTNNGIDFRPLYRSLELHPGLVVILPSVSRQRQIELFKVVLQRVLSEPDTVNKLIEVTAEAELLISDLSSTGGGA